MDNDLTDFLTLLNNLRGLPKSQRAQDAIEGYYDFLEAVGVEHCNFGGFEIDANGAPSVNQFSGTKLSPGFIEEFTEELAVDDYVLRRAELLTPAQPITKFETGLPVLDAIEEFHAPSRAVQIECARQGIEEGVALLGNTSLIAGAGEGEGRYFGFVFGGAKGTKSVLDDRGKTIEIAAFALLDQIMPQIEMAIDGSDATLTPREQDCLAAIAAGRQRKQIAFDHNISLPTVDLRIAQIKRKLGATTLPEAVARGYRYGIL